MKEERAYSKKRNGLCGGGVLQPYSLEFEFDRRAAERGRKRAKSHNIHRGEVVSTGLIE